MAMLRLKYVNSFVDRHGRRRHQCRIPGRKSFALPGLPGSAEFMEAYQAALAFASAADNLEIGASRTKAGTVNAARVAYYKSKKYFISPLAPATQRIRRNILDGFCARQAPSGQTYGDKRIALLQRSHIEKLLESMTPAAQRNWLKALRGLMAFALSENMIAKDPTQGVTPVKAAKTMGHMTWLESQVAMYREHHMLGTVARTALELLLNIAARRHDAHLLGDQHIRQGRICWRPHKTLRTTNKLLKVKILPEFQAAFDAMQRPAGVLNFLTNDYGKAFASAAAFGNKFANWCKAAGLKPVLCDDGKMRSYRAHGLRKAALRAYAHAGATDRELMELSGHSDPRQLREYLQEVEQEKMADSAVEKLLEKRAADQNGNTDLQTLRPALTNRKVSA
jgi:integrase/recombinase XerD